MKLDCIGLFLSPNTRESESDGSSLIFVEQRRRLLGTDEKEEEREIPQWEKVSRERLDRGTVPERLRRVEEEEEKAAKKRDNGAFLFFCTGAFRIAYLAHSFFVLEHPSSSWTFIAVSCLSHSRPTDRPAGCHRDHQ